MKASVAVAVTDRTVRTPGSRARNPGGPAGPDGTVGLPALRRWQRPPRRRPLSSEAWLQASFSEFRGTTAAS
eukprot:754811-Hanusia_phi.AAC.4